MRRFILGVAGAHAVVGSRAALSQVIADPKASYFGVELNDQSLVPAGQARLGAVRFDTWLGQQRKVA